MKAVWSFWRCLPLARDLLARGRIPVLLWQVSRKLASGSGIAANLREQATLLLALCSAWWRGEYRQISKEAVIAFVAALVYFLTPLDALPDLIPGLGLLDDLTVLGWVFSKWSGELEAFRVWQQARTPEQQAALLQLPPPEPGDRTL